LEWLVKKKKKVIWKAKSIYWRNKFFTEEFNSSTDIKKTFPPKQAQTLSYTSH